ncbi:MAG: hypothetical protein RLO37_18395 [Coleofasciculus chthonoplastes F1-TOW-03]
MNYSYQYFARLSQGKNVRIPYQDIFLEYRFRQDLQQKPKILTSPNWLKEQKTSLIKCSKA